jgi:hypothetical protein
MFQAPSDKQAPQIDRSGDLPIMGSIGGTSMPDLRRFPRILPGKFRNNFGDYLMEISLAQKNFVLSKRGKPMALFTPVEPRATGKSVTPSQYRHNSSEYLARVRWAKERFIIVKRGRKLAWMRPVEDLGLTP